MKNTKKIGVIYDTLNKQASYFSNSLTNKLNFINLNQEPHKITDIETIIVIGGDGFMLHAVHQFLSFDVNFYGINYGNLGFLLNSKCKEDKLLENIYNAKEVKLKLLKAEITTSNKTFKSYAINEVTLFRETGQVAKIKISINGIVRMEELVSDGIVLSTAAGSTAYNFSLHGPIFSPNANVLSLCPVSPFRPRHWRGALILEESEVDFEVLEHKKRPVIATTDFNHFNDIRGVKTVLCPKKNIKILFNKEKPFEEKILEEQFII